MSALNICYVLDCSGSMVDMPSEGMNILRKNVKDLIEVEPTKKKLIRIFEFGDVINSFSFDLKDIDAKFSNKYWKYSMGRTSLYDAITVSILHCKDEGGLITIITDGRENESWIKKDVAIELIRCFRTKHSGKIMLIGPGDEAFLKECLDGQVDSVFALNPETVHKDIVDCISSESHRSATQHLLSCSLLEE